MSYFCIDFVYKTFVQPQDPDMYWKLDMWVLAQFLAYNVFFVSEPHCCMYQNISPIDSM